MKKERLDVLLVKKGLASSREKAKAIIMSGIVFVDGQREDKAGSTFDEKQEIVVKGKTLKYVSRGGLKLEKAMNNFDIVLKDKVCMDVGHGQLDWKLRNDERVVCMERTNMRYMTEDDIDEKASFVSIDVSFISLTKILPAVYRILNMGGEVVALIKPQFEAGREKVGKKGVVRDPKVHEEVIEKICDFASSNGFELLHLDYSPIKGPEGNIEYLLHMRKTETMENGHTMADQIIKIVDASHNDLAKNKE